MTEPAPSPEENLYSEAPRLAALATRELYAEKPQLEALGEKGRRHTEEDFGHHLRALSSLDTERFTEYVRYCMGLFDARGFPQEWLADAWRHMERVMVRELPPGLAQEATAVLRAGVTTAAEKPALD